MLWIKGSITLKIKIIRGNLYSSVLLLRVLAIVLTTVLICPLISSFACSMQSPVAREKLVLGVYAGDFSSLIWVAENRGYFRDEGLDVTLKEYESGVLAVQALLRGEVEVATAADFVAVNNIFSNSSIRIIGAISNNKSTEVIVRPDHDIQNPADLRNKKIATPKESISEFYLSKFLFLNNLTFNDVQIVYLNPKPLSEALIQGEVDAAAIWDPFAYDLKTALGQNGIAWLSPIVQNWNFLLMTSDATLKSRPGALESLLKSLYKAEDFIGKSPESAKTIVAERLKLQMPYMQYAWSKSNYTLSLDQWLLLMMEDEGEWMVQNKMTDKTVVPNYLNNIYMEGLLKVNPKAVTIIR